MVNVIIVFPKIEEAKSIKNLLIRNGISVTKVCTTGAQAAQAADACDDGVIICGYKFLDMMYSDLENYNVFVFRSASFHSCHRTSHR